MTDDFPSLNLSVCFRSIFVIVTCIGLLAIALVFFYAPLRGILTERWPGTIIFNESIHFAPNDDKVMLPSPTNRGGLCEFVVFNYRDQLYAIADSAVETEKRYWVCRKQVVISNQTRPVFIIMGGLGSYWFGKIIALLICWLLWLGCVGFAISKCKVTRP
jgi:hypothetical protein